MTKNILKLHKVFIFHIQLIFDILLATTTFHLSEDPETQVAALGPDSLNASTRPSLIPNTAGLLPKDRRELEREPILLKGSFLTDEAFQALKTDLTVDLIENTFGRYVSIARVSKLLLMDFPAAKSCTARGH